MARIRSVDFLPEIFQTVTNKKFLSSTLDQLIQEPKLKATQGYIGRLNAPGRTPADGYVDEPSEVRTNYQLEPGVVFNDENENTVDALSYMGLLDGLKTSGANVTNHDRLFRSETYSWSPFIDFDKFVNYSQYFWVPGGPSSVTVNAQSVFTTNEFNIVRGIEDYSIDGFDIINPVLTVVRGQDYTFNVSQDSNPFYIQTQVGTSGTVQWADNISSREVLGVTNNGEDNGTITFSVPLADAQDFYHTLTDIGDVDLATEARFDSISNQTLSTIGDISEIQDLHLKTIVFLNDEPGTSLEAGWQYIIGDMSPSNFLDLKSQRYQIFQIELDYSMNAFDPTVILHPLQSIANFERFTIQYGADFSNISFFKNTSGYLEKVPLTTASLDTLYYQDANDENLVGIINVINPNEAATLDVNTIIGQKTYTSPNGVIFTNGLKVLFNGEVTPAEYTDNEYYVEGVGTEIRLVPTVDLIIPEPYTRSSSSPWDVNPWDSQGWDGTLNAPIDHDYITINRSSIDKNAWSRSNRWFHIDVILQSAEHNNVVANLDNDNRANRPIIEFDADINLFNYGTSGKKSVNIIDFDITDAFSDLNGQEFGEPEQIIDGYQISDGTRIIFAADTDVTVRNKIYVVRLVDVTNTGTFIVNLEPADDSDIIYNDVVVVANGNTLQGIVFTFDGTTWVESQLKTSVNQSPLFNIYDAAGDLISDLDLYPSTSFTGTKLFSYAVGAGSVDEVLGFPLKFLNINNLGDIVFDNNLYVDTFSHVRDGIFTDSPISDGFVRKYYTNSDFTDEIGWVKSVEPAYSAQILRFVYNDEPITLDVLPKVDLLIPSVSLCVNNTFVDPNDYTIDGMNITIHAGIELGDDIEVRVISDDISKIGYYEIPSNLSSNIFNENTLFLTLGTIRNHYNKLAQNIIEIEGVINGANNLRDLGDITKYGTVLVQQSSPLALTSLFLRSKEYNFFDAVTFNAQQYEKLKNQIIDWVANHDVFEMSPGTILDSALTEINANKNIDSSFYWSDMLPSGLDFELTEYIITAISSATFSTLNSYDFTQANNNALLVYFNGTLLIKDTDYTVASDGPRITLLFDTDPGDTLLITEYNSTVGSNVPNTPTKLGLYPKYIPVKFIDDTYTKPTWMIRGHDGSLTVAYSEIDPAPGVEEDIRDIVLLEFEKRIYNNIKVNSDIPIATSDVTPGQFRETNYTDKEISETLSPSLLSWLGWNNIEYKDQEYVKEDEKTWNYSSAGNKLSDDAPLKGNWRGIYNYFYDTDAPHQRPWEMLGLTERPLWWELRYGPAPYTRGNLVLWDDLEAGILKDPAGDIIFEKFKRPGLTSILPVDDEGNLLMPLQSVVGSYNQYNFKKSWVVGDEGPAESAWRKSSAWPFAIQILLALTKPAQYFALMADRDRYTFDAVQDQFLYDSRHRIDSRTIEIADTTVIKHSYINWIVDYNKHFGFESTEKLVSDLRNMDIKLCHHMASFSDKNSLKIFTDKSSPDSTNNSLLLPDESYDLLLYKNESIDEIIYSSVIIQKLQNGYAVFGNSITDPFFKIAASLPNGKNKSVTVGRTVNTATTVKIPQDFSNEIIYVPYGFVYSNKHAVVNFLAGYSEYLDKQGLKFLNTEGDQVLGWEAMIKEFVYWTDQGWTPGSVINLNPAAVALEFERPFTIVDSLNDLAINEQPLDSNGVPLDNTDFVVDRLENNFKIRMLNNKIISYLKFKLTSFEHLLILDNTSIFNDLMYNPVTGVRQTRVKLSGFTTYEWNGQLDAQGFLYNEDNVAQWATTKSYNKGDIVKFKNAYWSASDKIQPAEEFDFNDWIKTDYDNISKGLLPNLATKSDQLLNFYNNKTANLESDIDLMALGLIGFRPRSYLQSLDLDDISQVNIYSEMIKSKGTIDSLNLFKNVTLNKEKVDYEIFENWGIKRAEYGATGSKAFIDLQLDETLHTSNPSLVEISNAATASLDGDQIIPTALIYKQSEKHSTSDILPLLNDKNFDTSFPSAGFVTLDEIDIATYDLTTFDAIDDGEIAVEDDTLIWVAKDANSGWNVYRTNQISQIISCVIDNLDDTLTIEFDVAPDLMLGDIITIQNLTDTIDGTYTINSADGTQFNIDGSLPGDQTTLEGASGIVLKFISARVQVPSDIAGSVHDNNLNATDKVWVDETNGKMATFVKSQPFSEKVTFQNESQISFSDFGHSVVQGYDDAGMMIGNPSEGTVHCYDKFGRANYTIDQTLSLVGTTVDSYGESITFSITWAAIGAPGDVATPGLVTTVNRIKNIGIFAETQILVSPSLVTDTNFGEHVILSADENWLYVGESSENKVHAYQKVDYQNQSITVVADGIFNQVNVIDSIDVNNGNQLVVTIDSVAQVNTVDYTYGTGIVTFTVIPDEDSTIKISRLNTNIFTGDGIEDTFTLTNLYALNGVESIAVRVGGALQRPGYDYDLSGSDVVFTSPPPSSTSANINVDLKTYFKFVTTIENVSGVEFGATVDVTPDSTHIIITDPGVNSGEGEAYLYDRVVERFVVATPGEQVFTSDRTLVHVFVNNIQQVDDEFNVNADYSVTGANEITMNETDLAAGDFIDMSTNEFILLQTLSQGARTNTDASFGKTASMCQSKCSVYIGAPNDSFDILEGGSVTRFVNRSRIYANLTATIQSPSLTPGHTIRVNNIEVEIGTLGTVDELAAAILAKVTPNVTASVTDGYLSINLINKEIMSLADRLDVAPGVGTAYDDLGFISYTESQVITGPVTGERAHFGASLQVDNTNQIVVGAIDVVTVDSTIHTVDNDSVMSLMSYAKVFTYDLLEDATVFSEGKLVFGQLVYNDLLTTANSVAINLVDGVLAIGDTYYSTNILTETGRVVLFDNPTEELSWTISKLEKIPVDTNLIDSVYIYDNESFLVNQYLDYIDPLNGKILGAAQQNIDIIGVNDPAVYGSSHNGLLWSGEQLEKIWWDVSTVRFLDYNLEDIRSAGKTWGTLFPGSSVDVYQWIESDVTPDLYDGLGTVYDVTKFVTITTINSTGALQDSYFFWVKGLSSISTNSEKTLSVEAIASYIESPIGSGISFVSFIAPNVYGLYNSKVFLDESKSTLHIEYNKIKNDNNVFVEYDLIRENHPTDFLSDSLYKKLQDSFVGVDELGNVVPDVSLSFSDRFGIDFRPRKSMFVDRIAALTSYLKKVNSIIKQHTIVESRVYPLLNSEEPVPPAIIGVEIQWDEKVFDAEELGFQDVSLKPIGYKYLLETDENNSGLWTIHEVIDAGGNNALQLFQVQSYDTKRFWDTADWYAEDFNEFDKIDFVVNSVSELSTLNVALNSIIKVTSNSVNKWEIYKLLVTGYERVGLEDGTIQFSEKLWNNELGRFGFDSEVFDSLAFAEEPTIELRNVIKSINEELLISDLSVKRNQTFISVFNYILAEQPHVDWLHKTSLIDVNHKVRSLSQYAVFQKDNQDFLLDYIKEAKPYHTKIKDFLLSYDGNELMEGSVTDFDCPSEYNADFEKFISPVLDDGAILETDASNVLANDSQWEQRPWDQWIANYRLSIEDVIITNVGSGYTETPVIEVSGESIEPAQMTAVIINEQLNQVIIDNPGSGYTETPIITFVGGNGQDATAVVVTDNKLVRTIKTTIKYDRYQYESKIVNWDDNDNSLTKNLVIHKEADNINSDIIHDMIYRVTTLNISGSFVPANYQAVTEIIDDPENPGTNIIRLDPTVVPALDAVEKLYIKEGLPEWNANDNSIFKNYVRYNNKVYLVNEANTDIEFLLEKYTEIDIESFGGIDRTTGFYVSDALHPGLDLSLLIDGIAYPGVEVDGKNFPVTAGEFVIGKQYKIVSIGVAPDETDFTLVGADDNNIDTVFTATGVGAGNGEAVLNTAIDATYESVFPRQSADTIEVGSKYQIVSTGSTDFTLVGAVDSNPDTVFTATDVATGTGIVIPVDDSYVGSIPAAGLYSLDEYSDSLESYSGTRSSDIDVAGGEFIDTYHSHAPDELVPCSVFDTLDIKVFSRPGGDYNNDGHAFKIDSTIYNMTDTDETISFITVSKYPIELILVNLTTGITIYEDTDYTIDWTNSTIHITSNIAPDDQLNVFIYEIGGGMQLHRSFITGLDLLSNTTEIPVNLPEIYETIIFVNGSKTTNFTIDSVDAQTSLITLLDVIGVNDVITITVFGFEIPQHEESYPVTQTFTAAPYNVTPGELTTKNNHNAIVEVEGIRLRPPEGRRHIGDGSTTSFLFPVTSDVQQDLVADNKVDVYLNEDLLLQGVDYDVGPTIGLIIDNEPRSVILTVAPAFGDVVDVYISQLAEYSIAGDTVTLNVPVGGDLVAVTAFRDTSQLDILTQVFAGPSISYEIDKPLITSPNRLWVTLNGLRLLAGTDYSIINDNLLILTTPIIVSTDILVVMSITDSIVTNGVNFRLFKDMRDNVGMYSLSDSSSTYLIQDLDPEDDIIYVRDASVLGHPDLDNAKFGILTIGGERITYRERNLLDNTVSGLRRGTAGTAFDDHVINDVVFDISSKSLVLWDYDQIWYAEGDGTASDGIPLTDQTTIPALFIKN